MALIYFVLGKLVQALEELIRITGYDLWIDYEQYNPRVEKFLVCKRSPCDIILYIGPFSLVISKSKR